MNALPSLVQHAVVEKPWEDFTAKSSDLWSRHRSNIEEWENRNPSPPPAYSQFHDAGRGVIRYGHPRYYEWQARRQAVIVESTLEHEDQNYELLMDNQEPLFNEAYWVDDWALLSPITNFQILAYMIARTTLRERLLLADEGIAYRSAYFEHLLRERIIGSQRWFTDDGPDQEGIVVDPENVTTAMLAPESDFSMQRRAWVLEQEKIVARSPRGLDLSSVPPFPGAGRYSLAQTLAHMVPGLSVMLLTLVAALLAATARFLRYDPS
jgi:hypothetical protein